MRWRGQRESENVEDRRGQRRGRLPVDAREVGLGVRASGPIHGFEQNVSVGRQRVAVGCQLHGVEPIPGIVFGRGRGSDGFQQGV